MLTNLMGKFTLLIVAATFASTVGAQVIGEPYRLNDKEVEKIIHHIEQQSDKFRSSLDAALDKSRFNGTNREDDINAFVKEFNKETKNLHDRFDHHKSTAPDVQTVLERAERIDGFMRRYPLSSRAQDDWSTLKTSLDELAVAYNVSWRWREYPGPTGVSNPAAGYPTGVAVSDVPYRITDREVEQVLKRIEQQSNRFRSAVDSALDKSRLDGTRREDDVNAFIKDFYEATKTLRNHFNAHKSTAADVQSVLDRASQIDDFMRRNRLKKNAEKEWANLKLNLDELARVYNVSWQWRY